jgi:bacterioferritin-associated ferredoxin
MIVCICANQNEKSVREGLKRTRCVKTFKNQTGACKQCCKCKHTIDSIALEVLGKNTI